MKRIRDGIAATFEDELTAADPALGRVIAEVVRRIGQQRIKPSGATPFEAVVRAITYQSVSGKAATVVFARLKQALGGNVSPELILRVSEDSVASAGLSKAKSRAILNSAEWFTANRKIAKALPNMSDDEVVAALTEIGGIGVWTANVVLIFDLGRLDVVPAGDLGIRRGVQLVYGFKDAATPKQVHEKALLWSPYRSIASVYLWNAVKLKVASNDLTC